MFCGNFTENFHLDYEQSTIFAGLHKQIPNEEILHLSEINPHIIRLKLKAVLLLAETQWPTLHSVTVP